MSCPWGTGGRRHWPGAGAAVALLVVSGAAREAGRPWQRVGVRVLGSWTAASALLVLILALKR